MPSPTTLICPAKVNLFLEVRGKRPDGYHELGTLFQAVEFGDALNAESWDRIKVVSDVEIPGRPEDNLVYKAAVLLQTRHGGRLKPGQGLRYSLKKRIPTGAGLGGGSSDAAAALQLANEIWELGLSHGELRAMALELGADVAFFQFHPSAFGEGRGEILSRAPEPFPFHVVLATPFCRVETAWAYRQFQGRSFGTKWGKFKSSYAAGAGNPSFYAGLHNDFEDIMADHFHEIRDVRDILTSFQPQKILLTGSGASLFALFLEQAKAEECLNTVAPYCRFSTLTRFKTGEFF